MKVQCQLIILLVLIMQTGCVSSESIQTTFEPTVSSTFEKIEPVPSPMTEIAPENFPQDLILQAKAQLAGKLGIEADAILLSYVNAVEWPDASLGCPRADILYAQVTTPGYRILLEANGQAYTFHTDEKDQVILCDARGPDEIYLPP